MAFLSCSGCPGEYTARKTFRVMLCGFMVKTKFHVSVIE